ncbi:MAG: DUF3999 family protein [Acidobacteriota bacterium]
MRRTALLLVALASSARIAAGQPAPLTAAWQHWQFAAPVLVEDAGGSGMVAVSVPIDVTRRAATNWADLRVVDNDGRETPYVLYARPGGSTAEWRPATILEPSIVAKQFTQVVVDAGVESRVHNSARLQVATSTDFVTWVEIAASDDARTWRVVRERSPIYNLRLAGIGENTTATYPDTISRYHRFRLLDGSRRYDITSVDLAARVTSAAELMPAGFTLETSQESGRSIWTSTGAVSTLPIAEVRFDTAQPEFLRPVVVESSDDGTRWQRESSGEIYRMTERGQPRTALNVLVPEKSAAYWRITVHNRNDAPLADLHPVLQTVPRRVVFRPELGRTYRLVYGNPRATRPQYELARLVDASALDAATIARLGDARQNASYADPAPWTERHPVVLWSALGIAVAGLGFLAVRTLQGG